MGEYRSGLACPVLTWICFLEDHSWITDTLVGASIQDLSSQTGEEGDVTLAWEGCDHTLASCLHWLTLFSSSMETVQKAKVSSAFSYN